MTALAYADATAAHWERLEAERETASGKAESCRALMALFPHRHLPAPLIPGFCECGHSKRAGIHR